MCWIRSTKGGDALGDQGSVDYNFNQSNPTTGYSIGRCGRVEKWDNRDYALAGTLITGQAINYSQTMNTLRDDDWYELNPVIDFIYDEWGREGVIAWKVGTTAALLLLADKVPQYRSEILWVSNTIVWSVVGHDIYVGVGFSW